MISIPESVVIPTQSIMHLGFVIDSNSMTVSISEEKANRLYEGIQDLLRKSRPTIRLVASVVGGLIATRPANRHALLFTKMCESEKTAALKANGFKFDQKMNLSETMRVELNWWVKNVCSLVRPIHMEVASIIGLKMKANIT